MTAGDKKLLSLLSKTYPNIGAVSSEIINLKAILNLPKGTEHFHSDWLCRGNEIAKWLACTFGDYNVFTGKASSYAGKDYEYVILDDDDDMLMCQKDNFICVDRYTALTEEHIERAIDIFERRNLNK